MLQCEEFETAQPDPTPTRAARAVVPTPHRVSEPGSEGAMLGLCGNCEARSRCTFLKPEAGVWRCEEYA